MQDFPLSSSKDLDGADGANPDDAGAAPFAGAYSDDRERLERERERLLSVRNNQALALLLTF